MAKIVELPRLSDTMEEGVIAKWHVKVGDKVKRGQVIADVETDKATMEFESFDSGIVLKLVAAEGEAMPIGTPIAVLGKEGEDPDAALGGGGDEKASAKDEAPAEADDDGDDDDEADDDDAEDQDDDDEAEAKPKKGKGKPKKSKGKKSKESKGKKAKASAPEPDASDDEDDGDDTREAGPADARIAASPLARRLARELGVDLSGVSGSGPHGRIVKTDVEEAASRPAAAAKATGTRVAAGDRSFVSRPDAPQKLSQMRKTIAKRMGQANAEIPHFYLTTKIDMDRAVAARTEINEAFPDGKVSFNDFVIYATAKALVRHPEINAYWDGSTIVWRGDIHVGMAVAVDEGLIVPPIHFTDQKTLREIATEAKDLGARARDKKLSPQQMTGSSFTVSNLGMFGIEEFSAVINPGEGAILAVGAITDEVVPDGAGGFRVAKRMKATLACDHRVMDGAVGAKFLATLRTLLERPLAMLA